VFGHSYFGDSYFGDSYFPDGTVTAAPTGTPQYFPHGYFGDSYFADSYFPGDGLVVPPPTPTPDRSAVGGGRPRRLPRTIHGHGRLWFQSLELEATGEIFDPAHGPAVPVLHALALSSRGLSMAPTSHGPGQASTTTRLGLISGGTGVPPAKPKRARPDRRRDEEEENDLLEWWTRH
jgi:hypothetical protein